MSSVTRLESGLHCIDLNFQGCPGVIASYLLEDGGERVLIETGPTSAMDALLAGLDEIGVEPESISKLLVTHIHLDHAGASGALIRRFPNMRLYVHEVGAPHMADPAKLMASATRIYGDMMDVLWGEMVPVPAAGMTVLTDGDLIPVGSRRLRALYTPGHASHHLAFHDQGSGAVFTGDVAGVRIQSARLIRPPTPPPDIDLELWASSIERVRSLKPAVLYLGHFGPYQDVEEHLQTLREQLVAWAEEVRRALNSGQDRAAISDNLRFRADAELTEIATGALTMRQYDLASPIGMSTDGLIRYWTKRRH